MNPGADDRGAGSSSTRELDARWLELVEGTVHNLRTPLATVTGYLELLALDAEGLGPRQRDHLARAAQGARELARQIELAHGIARFEAGVVPEPDAERPLLSLVDTALLRFGEDERARIVWRARHAADVRVRCNSDLLGRAIAGLVARSLSRAPEGERVELATEAAAGRWRFEARDRGTPIAPEQVADLFGRFGSSGGRRRSPKLELYFGRLVAEALGGTAGARTSEDGETSLWLELPAIDSVSPG